ncbi:multidrug efflux MFS transporter [Nonomuraea indica]|nr:multidrug efflux MFS transporter [Nonomuraea indica]
MSTLRLPRLSADRDEDVQDGGLIDNTILNLAIPSLMRELGASRRARETI